MSSSQLNILKRLPPNPQFFSHWKKRQEGYKDAAQDDCWWIAGWLVVVDGNNWKWLEWNGFTDLRENIAKIYICILLCNWNNWKYFWNHCCMFFFFLFFLSSARLLFVFAFKNEFQSSAIIMRRKLSHKRDYRRKHPPNQRTTHRPSTHPPIHHFHPLKILMRWQKFVFVLVFVFATLIIFKF